MVKGFCFVFLIIIFGELSCLAQPYRYFEFSTTCMYGNWKDSSFIAATSDQVVIDTVLANLTRPYEFRKLINGNIDFGSGGYNHNASHWFSWHFIPNQWDLVEFAMEVCDGCPYTDVDLDTVYWVQTLGQFCPWSGRPVREITQPSSVDDSLFSKGVLFFPNPASDKIKLKWPGDSDIMVLVVSAIGKELLKIELNSIQNEIDLSVFSQGVYFLRIQGKNGICVKRLVIEG